MNSLFVKTFAWLTAAAGASFVVAVLLIGRITPEPTESFRALGEELRAFQATYARDGSDAAIAAQREFFERHGVMPYLLDESGTDVLDGSDRSSLLETGSPRAFRPVPGRDPRFGRRPPGGGRFAPGDVPVFAVLDWESRIRRNAMRWRLLRGAPFVIALLSVLTASLLLAWYLAAPLRRLEQTVARFGAGDFSARTRLRQNDEIGKLGRAFDLMADRVESVVASHRHLLQDVSHELRTPLTRLNLYLEQLDPGDPTVQRLGVESERVNALLGQILTLSRLQAERRPEDADEVQLDDLVAATVASCAPEAAARPCSIELGDVDSCRLRGLPDLLRSAVENVLRNAIQHAPPGSAIEVSILREGDRAAISIRDRGPGVPESALADLFEPFFRVDEARTPGEGHGLGLSIARRAVELHGGEASATNANPGLRVTLTLPLESAAASSTN